jgi:hypothetical protein
MTKKKYFPNNWKLYKDADESFFMDHTFDEFMEWKLGGWELPSSVCCIIRESDPKTKKVKEHVYSKPSYAKKKILKLMEKEREFTIVDESAVHQMYPNEHYL